jgi:hypothetical protein
VSRRQLIPLKEAVKHHPWATERRCRRLVAEKRISFHVIDRRIFFDLADLDAYAEAGRHEAVS